MTPGVLLARLRAIGARLVNEHQLLLPEGLSVAEQIELTKAAKEHRKVVVAALMRPEPTPEVSAMLAEVEQLAGPASLDLIEDVRAGAIRPDDLLRWVRAWHRERFRPMVTCGECGTAIDCLLLSQKCRECIAREIPLASAEQEPESSTAGHHERHSCS